MINVLLYYFRIFLFLPSFHQWLGTLFAFSYILIANLENHKKICPAGGYIHSSVPRRSGGVFVLPLRMEEENAAISVPGAYMPDPYANLS
jgi:hypothetical protein